MTDPPAPTGQACKKTARVTGRFRTPSGSSTKRSRKMLFPSLSAGGGAAVAALRPAPPALRPAPRGWSVVVASLPVLSRSTRSRKRTSWIAVAALRLRPPVCFDESMPHAEQRPTWGAPSCVWCPSAPDDIPAKSTSTSSSKISGRSVATYTSNRLIARTRAACDDRRSPSRSDAISSAANAGLRRISSAIAQQPRQLLPTAGKFVFGVS